METECLRFGEHRIDLQRRLLYHGDRLLEPERREFELLRLLVEAHPETLTRRELIDRLWPRQEISDASLAQLIRRTRQLLGDDAHQPRYLKTLHGIGLRLIPEPRPDTAAAHTPPRRRIGLLPVVNASDEPENSWIEHGLAEILLQKLERETGLSVQLIPDGSGDLPVQLDQFGCEALLSLRLEPGFIPRKLSWKLHLAAGTTIEPERVEGHSIVEAAEQLVQRLPELLFQPGQIGADRSNIPSHSEDPDANIRYGQGLQQLHAGHYRDAESSLREALALDGDFAWARVKLADALYRQNRLDEARSLLEPMLEASLDEPAISIEARQILANLMYVEGRIEASLRESGQLIELARQQGDRLLEANQWMNMGTSSQCLGEAQDAFSDIEQALDIYREIGFEPGIGNALYNLGNVHHGLAEWPQAYSRYEQAELIFERCGHVNHQAQVRFEMAMVLRSTSQPVERVRTALQEAGAVFEQTGDAEGLALVDIELLHCAIDEGDFAHSRNRLEALLPELEERQLAYPAFLARHQLIRACLNLHDTTAASRLLEQEQEYKPDDPMYELLHAHCACLERRFDDAVTLAEAVRERHPATWKEQHQQLLEGYRKARSSGAWHGQPL